jgi:hypothetical protein
LKTVIEEVNVEIEEIDDLAGDQDHGRYMERIETDGKNIINDDDNNINNKNDDGGEFHDEEKRIIIEVEDKLSAITVPRYGDGVLI